MDVLDHLRVGQPHPVLGGLDDADVGLVGDEEVHVGAGEVVAEEELLARRPRTSGPRT